MESFDAIKIVTPALNNRKHENIVLAKPQENFLLDDDIGELGLIDTRKFISPDKDSNTNIILDEIPTKITGTYVEDYNILYVDEIVRKKLSQEKYTSLACLKDKYNMLENATLSPQTHLMREKTLKSMRQLQDEIEDIETGAKIKTYCSKVSDILTKYKTYHGKVRTISFCIEEEVYQELDDEVRYRIFLIDSYLNIASEYISIDIIRTNNKPSDICMGCGISIAKVAISDEGTIICPNIECQTEHNVAILSKLAKDGSRINTNTSSEDESIENFMRAFIRYQGLQPDQPDQNIYEELDRYFIRNGRPSGAEIRQLKLNNRGQRGDTNHKMLWDALSQIGRSCYYEDANLIGNIYWGWSLPKVMHLKERIIDKYNKTQRVYYRIPLKERCRNSSLGTQLRLWLHLRLEGHECYMDQFKIAENLESLRNQMDLWKQMCEGANDPDIYYIS